MTKRPPRFNAPRHGKRYVRPDDPGRNRTKRMRGRRWMALRKQVLNEEPLCPCGMPSWEVDHIIPLGLGGSNARENLRGLCVVCHAKKTLADIRAIEDTKNRSSLGSGNPRPKSSHGST